MKRILIIKLTSLGDLVHTLPSISDIHQRFPNTEIDWVVDSSFQEIALFHPAVTNIFPTNHRKWLRNWNRFESYRAIYQLIKKIREKRYDLVIDAQCNIKSSFLAFFARGEKAGCDRKSAAESIASLAYTHRYYVPKVEHAIPRLRRLFSLALAYPFPENEPIYSIDTSRFLQPPITLPDKYVVFVHSASWVTKLWPEFHWISLIKRTVESGYKVLLPWGSPDEEARAKRLQISDDVIVLPRLSLREIGYILKHSQGTVSIDTGLSHLATALNIPTVSLYGATNSSLIGALGKRQVQLQATIPCSPCNKKQCLLNTDPPSCLVQISPEQVFQKLSSLLHQSPARQVLLIN